MRQQVRCHERSVTVSANTDAIRICHTHLRRLVYCCFCTHHDLFDVCVVYCLRITNDGHRRIVEYRVAFHQKEQMRHANYLSSSLRRASYLTGSTRVVELEWICPNNCR